MNTTWSIPEYDESVVRELAKDLGVSRTVARILINRDLTTAEAARAFLHPTLDQLHDPMLLPDMEAGVERTARALATGEKILVHGDYDVDGVTSTAILMRTLTILGANVIHHIPHRKTEGYDIKPLTADQAKAEGVSLIITADCGATACSTMERAETLGIDAVITDHHEQGSRMPKAVAVINPRRRDSKYPFADLAGVGVALKFAQALVRRLGHDDKKFVTKYLDLASLGTIADVMPLLGENRVIAKFGLEALAESKKIGVKAMLSKTGLAGQRLTTHSIGYVLGPRINAVGRLDSATIALDLMMTSDVDQAHTLVEVLEQRNQERQAEQAHIIEEVQELLAQKDIENCHGLVLAGAGWNSGVVGIAASKVVELCQRPAILLSIDEESGMASGSARSIAAMNMIEALGRCRHLLDRAGGHALAAGLSLKLENLAEFEAKFDAAAAELTRPEDLIPTIAVDEQIDPEKISWQLMEEISKLEPFGPGNPEPMFVSSGVGVVEARRVGGDGSHLKMKVRGKGNGLPVDCIGFGLGNFEPTLEVGRKIDVCYNIRVNSFNGHDTVQMAIKDIKEC